MNSIFVETHYKSNGEIKKALLDAGLENHFELENGLINVEESSTIQVEIINRTEGIETRMQFPQVGNTVQIIVTALLVILLLIVEFPNPWIVAILGGQLISFGFHYPKIKKLQEKVIQALKKSNAETTL